MDKLSRKKLDEILVKPADQLGEEEAAFLHARRSYLTESQRKDFKEIFAEVEKRNAEKDGSAEEEKKAEAPKKEKKAEVKKK